MVRRTDGEGWAFPGGRMEEGEDAAQCAYREFYEETGYRLGSAGKLLMRRIKDGVDFSNFVTDCESEFVPVLNHEHDAWAWVDARSILDEAKFAHHNATYGVTLPPPSMQTPVSDARADFDESKVNRDEEGKFSETEGGGSGSEIKPKKLASGEKGEAGYAYHVTNTDRLRDIAEGGELKTHKPGEFTDQDTWPDGSTEKRAYLANAPLDYFAPEDGVATAVRMKRTVEVKTERGTGDLYVTKPIKASDLEYQHEDGTWRNLTDKPKTKSGALVPAKFVAGRWKTGEGGDLPEHVVKLAIPPAYKDIKYNPDPGSMLVATSVTPKGKTAYHYSDVHHAKAAEAKFQRIDALDGEYDGIAKANESARTSDQPAKRDAADCLALIMATGVRPGAEETEGGYKAEKKAYGATTLRGEHVVSDGGKVKLVFVGKSGKDLMIPVDDPKLAQMVENRAAASGPDGNLFPETDDAKLRSHVHSLGGDGFKVKDFRTLVGTRTAKALVSKAGAPDTEAAYKKAVRTIAAEVAAKLGNTPAVALKAYIDPRVFLPLQASMKETRH